MRSREVIARLTGKFAGFSGETLADLAISKPLISVALAPPQVEIALVVRRGRITWRRRCRPGKGQAGDDDNGD
jgi:hypothetical protein